MAFSIQTNVSSLIAQENLRVTNEFQSRTINRLTSGYRINQSGDDAAGLAIANKFRSDVSELTQGVRNANDGISTLQIIDGGMNNISKMLDRLKTLATQSASDTFTGDRNVLNQEFSSLLSEIDRQAQAIGLDQNGQFAKSLSVFVGGGKTHATGAISIDNGSVAVDLRSASVDSQALGLKGMQVVAGTADIGTGNAYHSVAKILADTSNTTSTANYTDFYFSGPGFADGSKVKVSVNTQNVTDVDSLVTAINAAIGTAGNNGTQAASAFKSANVVASVHTDANGGKQLAFTSSSSAFQVEAGDRMANALMGNVGSTTSTGTAIASSVAGGNTAATTTAFTPTNVTVRISGGGMTSPVDLTFSTGATTVDLAIAELKTNVAANAALKAAGISVAGDAGGPLTFTSSRGESFSVMSTGDTANVLGLGAFVAGGSGAVDYTTVSGGSAYSSSTAYGTAHLQFSINGAASNTNDVSVDLNAGDATAAAATGTVAGTVADQNANTVILSVDGVSHTVTFAGATTTIAGAAAAINTQATGGGWGVSASVDSSGYLVLTSATKGANSSVNITGGTASAALGLAVANHTGTSRTAGDMVNALNSSIQGDAELVAAGLKATQVGGTVTIQSQNGTYFRLNTGATASTANVGFGTAGAAFAANLSATASYSTADSNGASNTTALSFNALAYGSDDQAVTISANDSSGTLHSLTIALKNDGSTSRYGRDIDEAINYINSQLQQSNDATLKKIVAVKEVATGEKINFLSALGKFSVSLGTSTNSNGIAGGVASTKDSATLGSASNIAIDTKANATAAVSALSSAVSSLGFAQAAVGKGQNQLTYALGLAQSQISNYSAAESRIRDADIASEAANLTKAQVLQQASMAAMAQANSAPQAVLALLRG